MELLSGRLSALDLPIGLARTCAAEIIDRVGEIASEPESGLRRLSVTDLHVFLGEVARQGQPGHEPRWSQASWTVAADSIDLPKHLAPRSEMLEQLTEMIAEEKCVWIHGASGTGKSTLAQQVSARDERGWLIVEFRGQTKASETLLRLERTYTDLTLASEAEGVVLDDIDADIVAQYPLRFARFIAWIRVQGYAVIFTASRALSPSLQQALGVQSRSLVTAPYLMWEDVRAALSQTKVPPDLADGWAMFIHASASGGHPQLVARKSRPHWSIATGQKTHSQRTFQDTPATPLS